jgi:hypothetical protein
MSTIARLANPDHIKLCGNGTYKTVFANWFVVPIGFLSKHYGKTTIRGMNSVTKSAATTWPTHFNPLVWVVASGETTGAYRLGLDALLRYGNAVCPALNLPRSVAQFHADLTPTAEKARKELLPQSIRVADFWHMSEAFKQMLIDTDADGTNAGQSFADWMYMTRTQAVTLTEHHNLLALVCKEFEPIIPKTVEAFKARFCYLVPVDTAQEQYGVEEPTMLEEGHVLCSMHWGGLGRVQPGSLGGEEAQESYHRRFNQHFQREDGRALRRAQPNEIFPALRTAVGIIAKEVAKAEKFYDLPTHDDPSLQSGTHLEKDGRSSSVQLFEANSRGDLVHKVDQAGWGHFCVMPRTLYKEVWHTIQGGERVKDFVLAEHDELRLTEEEAKNIVEMTVERNGKRLYRLWSRCGIRTPCWRPWKELFSPN